MKLCTMAVIGLFAGIGCIFAEETNQAPPLRVALRTQDGSNLVGTPAQADIIVETAIGRVSVPLALLKGMECEQQGGATTLLLQFLNGDRLSGTWKGDTFAMKTSFGDQQVQLSLLRSVQIQAGDGTTTVENDGMVLHYSFDDEESTLISDLSGKGNHGTSVQAIYTRDGKIGAARQVGKQAGYIQVPDQAAWSFGVNPFSICLWFKFDELPYGQQMFIGHDDGGGNQNKWLFGVSNGDLYFHINSPSRGGVVVAAHPWTPEVGKWYHLAVTRNGTAYSIYLDGAVVAIGNNSAPIPVAKAPLTIGQAEGLCVEGVIDELSIFHRTLSQDEIRQLATVAQ